MILNIAQRDWVLKLNVNVVIIYSGFNLIKNKL